MVPKMARSEPAKFRELHQAWREVYMDLNKIGAVNNLNNMLAMENFVNKFTSDTILAYVKFKSDASMAQKPESAVMNDFMLDYREKMLEVKRYLKRQTHLTKVDTQKDEDKMETRKCHKCGNPCHMQKDCRQKDPTNKKKKQANSTSANRDCPTCSQHHTYKAKDGKLMPSTRYSSCTKFYDLTTAAKKAACVESVASCAWCLDWTGGHKAKDCTWKGTCPIPGCTAKHHQQLHGSGNAYCNHLWAGV